jgi:Na+/H+ antiporter NhaD/arsenite permease-like protein
MNILLFLLACVGLTHILIDGSIFNWLRLWIMNRNIAWLSELWGCYLCLGAWTGALLSLLYNPLDLPWYVSFFLCGFASAFVSVLGAALLIFLNTTKE